MPETMPETMQFATPARRPIDAPPQPGSPPLSIERGSPLPLYQQLKQVLLERIALGEFAIGHSLPGDDALVQRYRLSRSTVRQALRELELAGIITRQRGRGTFLSGPKLRHGPGRGASLDEEMRQRGLRAGWQVLAIREVPVAPRAGERLGLAPGEFAFEIRRLRLADDEPIGLLVSWLPAAVGRRIEPGWLEVGGSMHFLAALELLAGSHAERTLDAVPADAELAALLGVDPGSSMLRVRRLVVGAAGEPLEDFCGTYRGDRFSYRLSGPVADPVAPMTASGESRG